MASSSSGTGKLSRELGFWSCLAIMLGNIIGAGIFLTPAEVAAASPNVATYLTLWALGGLMAASGAHVFAELGMLFPQAGGDYVFLDKAYGRSVARAWGLLAAFGTFPGSLAALAVGITATIAQTDMGAFLLVPIFSTDFFTLTTGDLFGIALIGLSMTVNLLGLSWTSALQMLLSLVPVGLFTIFAVAAIFGWHLDAADLVQRDSSSWDAKGLAAAGCAVFFTYSGWNVLTYIGGEIKEPHKTIPRVIFTGVTFTTVIYIVLNLAFITVMPLDELKNQQNAGVAVAAAQLGDAGAKAFSILLSMALLAGLNATMMAGARIAFAMGQDKLLWRQMRLVSPVRKTPVTAIWTQGIIASLLVLTGSFSFLLTWTGSILILLSCITASTIFVFRHKRRMEMPVKMKGYPWTAIIFLLVGLGIWVIGLVQSWKLFLVPLVIFVALSLIPYKDPNISNKAATGSDTKP
ncbi:MAG: APC family permease [Myxococcota bacterium]|nr:amino acid permease [Myxococcota bacterium]OQC42729.1 MAG: Serine/threonine exchanger SteT [Deltaproteobacteria bacterium ADurb.Bin058]HHW95653.1 amino acid permease [Oligoflexales bacterium]MBP8971531.1 amino acid permease [Myxococcota bacterium]HQC44665.1 amino acid permease [Myxococcota bacterium]